MRRPRLVILLTALLVLAGVTGGLWKLTSRDDEAIAAVPSAMVTVPSVTGRELPGAYAALHRAGLRVAIWHPFSISPLCMPLATGQLPKPGSIVLRGTAVSIRSGYCLLETLFGVAKASARVPDFAGRSLARVVDWAGRHRLFWEARKLPELPASNRPRLVDNYRVIRQKPGPGTTLRRGVFRWRLNEGTYRPTSIVVAAVTRD